MAAYALGLDRYGGIVDLSAVFEPKRMAVIGVSHSNIFHPANTVYHNNYYRYRVETFAVNPKGGEVERRPVYRSVSDIAGGVDLGVVAVKAPLVPGIARECAACGVRGLVVISGGFAETGTEEGKAYQAELVEICSENGMVLIGPNCLGVYSPPFLNTFFLPPERTILPKAGEVAVASQSGAILLDQMMTRLSEADVGISVAVSIGNKAMVGEADLVKYFASRDDTRIACFYIEGMDMRSSEFIRISGKVSMSKPVIVYLGGKSEKGQKAAVSHSAAMVGKEEIMSAALRQNGVIEAVDEEEITSFAKIFSYYHHRPLLHGNVAIITSSGGHGVIAADLADKAGLKIPTFSEDRREELRSVVGSTIKDIASFANPVDLTGSAADQDFERVLDLLIAQEDIEAIVVLVLPYTPVISSMLGSRMGQIVTGADKPVVAYVPNLAKYGMVLEGFELNGIPVVHTIAEAVQMLKALRLLGLTRSAASTG
jgi:acyl-CoA synthetase (NDP forming)